MGDDNQTMYYDHRDCLIQLNYVKDFEFFNGSLQSFKTRLVKDESCKELLLHRNKVITDRKKTVRRN